MMGCHLGALALGAARERLASTPLVVLPVAAGAKQHGAHLPLNTDQLVMEHLLDTLIAQRDVVVAPPVLHGWFPAFRDYPGTDIATADTFQRYVREVADSLVRHGARRLLLLNMGVSKATGLPLSIVARELAGAGGCRVMVVSWDDLETRETRQLADQDRGTHADEIETSIMLAIHPDRVDMSQAVADYTASRGGRIGYVPGTFESASGVFGDPTRATEAKGVRALEIMRERLLEAVDSFVG